jgi:cytosine/adenosine deaminase-related metal-dependent hydrolase
MGTDIPLPPAGMSTRIYAGKLFDSEARTLLPARVISIAQGSGLIESVEEYDPEQEITIGENTIDLRHATVMPGLVDAHVHCKHSSSLSLKTSHSIKDAMAFPLF